MSIYKKLADIQKELFVPKGNTNDFGGYKYRSCEDILKMAKPLCEKNGCVLYMTNELHHIGDENYAKAIVFLVDTESGEQIYSEAFAREEKEKKKMDGSQITGASSSYARKYALAGLFSIDNEKDSDTTNKGENNSEIAREDAIELAKLKTQVMKYINDNGKDFKEVFMNQKLTDPSQLTVKICKQYLAYIKKQEEQANE